MTKTQAGRLLTLAYFLRTQVPADKFNMAFIWDTKTECGCALGWGYQIFPDVTESISEALGVDGSSMATFRRLFGFEHYDRTPKQEANIIEEFVRSKGWEYGG